LALSSDEIVKREIIDFFGISTNQLKLRIFPQDSRSDQKLVSEGGLTFSYNSVNYGSCDALWLDENNIPFIALEGTDALNRGSSGNAQYQRFHHALGSVKLGYIGVYYLRKGNSKIQPDLYGMAFNASKIEKGTYLIIDDLKIVSDLIKYKSNSYKLNMYIQEYLIYMNQIYKKSFEIKYKNDWTKFSSRRSTIIKENYVIKYAARMVRNFTDSSQRAGHIALGEMYLTKYFFPEKKIFYLFPKMTQSDLNFIDDVKQKDKEWFLLRNEPNVQILSIDDIKGVSEEIKNSLLSIKNSPSKGEAKKTYDKAIKTLRLGLENNTLSIDI